MDSPLKWHGGKHYLREWHRSLTPAHTHYVEPYAGALSMLLAVTGEGVSEVVNDLHGGLTNFWKVLADPHRFEAFRRIMEATPFSKEAWETAGIGMLFDPKTQEEEVLRAADFMVWCRQSRQGLMKDFATLSKTRTRRGMNEQVSSWLTAVEGLPEVHARLKRVVVYNEKALDVVEREDGPTTFFYLDPPYLQETRTAKDAYQFEMTISDHLDLLAKLSSIKGKFMLCGYPSRTYMEVGDGCGWQVRIKQIDNKSSSAATKEIKTECVWMNYDPGDGKAATV